MSGRSDWPRAIHRVWPVIATVLVSTFAIVPLLAPVLLALHQTGPALAIYAFYRLTCHQWAHRSFFLLGPESSYTVDDLETYAGPDGPYGFLGSADFGYKMAFCERDFAIYGAAALASILFLALRNRIRPLPARWYLILLAPIVIDGFTQLFDLRESTPLLRVLTGACFGLANIWFIYPRVDAIIAAMMNLDARQRTRSRRYSNVE